MTNKSKVVRMDDHNDDIRYHANQYNLSDNSVTNCTIVQQHQVPLRRTVVEAGISELHLTRKPHWIDTGRVKVFFGEIALMFQRNVKRIVLTSNVTLRDTVWVNC